MKRLRKLAIILTALIAPAMVSAQLADTPYSRYGYGTLGDNATSTQRAMGGVGYAMNSGRQINVMNPASYAAIDSLTFLFDMGVDVNNLSTTDGTQKGHKFGVGLNYITMQFPITRWGGGSVGLLPFSSVGYSFGDKIANGLQSREGSGGISELYLGLAARPVKGLTAGVNLQYLFGTILHDNYAYTNTGSTALFERYMHIRDFRVQLGLQYSYQINKHNRITAGVTYTPGNSLKGETYGVYYDASENEIDPDTIGYNKLRGLYSLPDTWGAGLNWQWDDRLMVEVDATYQPWSKAKFQSFDEIGNTRFVDRYKGAVGFQYMHNSRGGYMSRVQYRAGFSATRDYWTVMGNTVREYGIHAGFGLPAPGGKTYINIGFEYKHRAARPQTLVKEDYIFVTLGVNFNELWFWQNKLR